MGFLPGRPDGNADRLRDGAAAWEGLAHDLWVLENDLGTRGAAGSVHDWWRGAASDAYLGDWQRVAGGFGDVDHQLHTVAHTLRDAAGQIETAQHTYDAIAGGIALTTAVGVGLTVFTLGISDVAAGGADAAEVGAATTAIEVLGGAIEGVTGTLDAVVPALEAAMVRLTLLLGELPPVVVEAGSGAAVGTGLAYALGERDGRTLALWGVVGAVNGLDGADDNDAPGVAPRWWGPPKPAGIQNPQLRSIANELYRRGATIGNGGTADAIRAGQGHEIKGAQRITQLSRWIAANPNASGGDIEIAQSMLQDLISAMAGEGYPGR